MRYFLATAIVLATVAVTYAAYAGPCYFYPPNVYWCY
jgi:hypothetical protein